MGNSKYIQDILGVCLFESLFQYGELVEVINIKAGEMKLNSSEEMMEFNWLKMIIEYYWVSLIFFGLMHFGIRTSRKKKGLE